MSNVASIISSQISSFITRTKMLPWNESPCLLRNFCSDSPYKSVLNQSLLFIHKHTLGLQSIFYGTYPQISSYGRLTPLSQGAITSWYERVGADDDNHLSLRYYWSFSLSQSSFCKDFRSLEEEYTAIDSLEQSEQIISEGFKKLEIKNPLNIKDYPSSSDYFAESIKKLVELVPVNQRENSLVGQLASSFFLSKAGYSLNHKYTEEEIKFLAKKIRDQPNWTINTFNQSNRVVNWLLN